MDQGQTGDDKNVVNKKQSFEITRNIHAELVSGRTGVNLAFSSLSLN